MFFLWPLQNNLVDYDEERCKQSGDVRILDYERRDESTISLRRFLKKLEILRQLSEIFGAVNIHQGTNYRRK